MRVMVFALAPSHLMCMVPFVWAVRAAGHDVVVIGKADVVGAAHRAGMCAIEVTPTTPPDLSEAAARRGRRDMATPNAMLAAFSPAQREKYGTQSWVPGEHPWEVRVGAVIEDCLAAATDWRPDLVLCDPIEYSGLVVAGALRVPAVVHRWGGPEALTSEGIARARDVLDDLCEHLGLADGLPAPRLTLDPCPPSLQFDSADPALGMRFVPYNGTATEQPALANPNRQRVAVSFGLFGSQASSKGGGLFIENADLTAKVNAVASALNRYPWLDVVLTVPAEALGDELDLPRQVRIADRVPLSSFLDTCDLVIHHGGTGTAMTACSLGLPQVVLPATHPSLAACASGLANRGIAYAVTDADDQTNVDVLADAVDATLNGTTYRKAASEVATEIAALPAPSAMVSELEKLVTADASPHRDDMTDQDRCRARS